MAPSHPIDLLAARLPIVAEWWAGYRADPTFDPVLRRLHLAELSRFLLNEAREGALPDQARFCQVLESVLTDADPDTDDTVALSVIEEFIVNGPTHGIDAQRLYDDLGPIARSHWQDLYKYIRHEPWAAA